MLTYKDFCDEAHFDSEGNNRDARRVFDALCHPEAIHSMMVFSKVGLPAFSGIAKELERDFADAPQFPLKENANRQIAGKMAKFVLGHFGYEPIQGNAKKNVKLREFSQAEHFKQSAIYAKTGQGIHRLSMKIL